MKLNPPIPSFSLPSSFKDPATKDTENAGNKRPPASDLQPENKRLRRSYSSLLQKQHAERKKLESNVKWESPEGPILTKPGLSLQRLTLDKKDIASGGFGSVSIFENENGDKLIGKVSIDTNVHLEIRNIDSLGDEVKAYQTVYKLKGTHPNLVNVYGIAQVPHGDETKRTMLMDFIPGPNGRAAFDALRKSWNVGKISSEEYWGAIQFIGRRLLDVTEHISEAGLVHNDIKPENFHVNEKTGEPVLIDLGGATEKGSPWAGGTPSYGAPEKNTIDLAGVDERSDVFTVGSSLLDGIEGMDNKGNSKLFPPNQGLRRENSIKDHRGDVVRKAGTYSTETAYTNFMRSVMAQEKKNRPNPMDAKDLDFLHEGMRMLGDDAAKEVIKKAISLVSIDNNQKPSPKKRGVKELANAFQTNPTLEGYASLQNLGKTNPDATNFQSYLKKRIGKFQAKVEQDAKKSAMELMTNATWIDNIKRISETAPKAPKVIKSGVDKDGVRLPHDRKKNINPDHGRAVRSALESLASYVDIEDLRRYANASEKFLDNVGTLNKIMDAEIPEKIEQVRERAEVARHMVELFDADPASSKPADGTVRNLKGELERQRRHHKSTGS